ncbi:4-coumarate--CoA ligase-like 9 [Forsythia ovata]|uniref:4-coumarate--CoA ligase-like 9 n=1 Tax=Forsythia ovata TaxID=205694 RepID=A0ABD1UY46_9LAMI
MAEYQSSNVDPRSGYCPQTKIFHSLRPSVPLPPPSQPLSVFSYTLSLIHSPTSIVSAALSTTSFLIDAATGRLLTYTTFLHQVHSLSSSLRSLYPSLSKNDVAFILSPPSLYVPVLYLSLLSLGITVSTANPLSSPSELTQHQSPPTNSPPKPKGQCVHSGIIEVNTQPGSLGKEPGFDSVAKVNNLDNSRYLEFV